MRKASGPGRGADGLFGLSGWSGLSGLFCLFGLSSLSGWDSPLTRPAFLARHARLAGRHSDLMNRQLSAPMTAPIVSASQSSQLDSRNGTKS